MQQRNSSPLSTILMGIPLAAMPLMAIFGIPNLAPLTAQTSELNSFFQSPPTDVAGQASAQPFNQTGFGESGQSSVTGSAAPAWNSGGTSAPTAEMGQASAPAANSLNAPQNRVEVPWQQDSQQNLTAQLANPVNTQPVTMVQQSSPQQNSATGIGVSGQQPVASPSAISWQGAIAQLQQWGIENYRLQAGSRPGQFLFVCFYKPAENPTLTVRYEAEAEDPLAAVSNVLQQIQGQSGL